MKFPDESVLGNVSIETAGEFEIVMRRVGSPLAGVDKTPSFYWHQAIEYVRGRVADEPTLAWPGEIDDILDDADARVPVDRPIAMAASTLTTQPKPTFVEYAGASRCLDCRDSASGKCTRHNR